MGYYRDGLGTTSPFFHFLAFWNALDVACEDHDGELRAWLQAANIPRRFIQEHDEPPDDWWAYLNNESRHAVAHAVRDPDRGPELDPNDIDDRARLTRDSRLLTQLVRTRVQERWGQYPIYGLPRRRG